jgi:hypothetical protein
VQAAGAAQPPQAPTPAAGGVKVTASADVNLRAQPSINSPRVSGAFTGETLNVLEADPDAAKAKIGKQDEWIFAQAKDGKRGWVAAWFVTLA